ncbi:HAD family hydrolase [Nonomuraea sp. SBT364]|uniref:HAD family hydrolase n=1 Tax=Nonomuraea sp. SBT364 TaxID=1580530 RepID=UPI00066E3570|nr:HAD family phosphatase [Nonomuraea sp. SBT364]
MKWIIFDYGNVLSLAQPDAEVDAMAAAAGADPAAFRQGYWKHRLDFDRGTLTACAYWSAVLGREVPAEEAARLVAMDVASWSHPDEDAVALLGELLAAGRGVALLSNAPAETSDGIDLLPWIAAIPHRFYSARMSMLKPDREIFDEVARVLGADPAEAVFVDDRPDNVAGAEAAGMTGVLYTGAADLRRRLA